MTLRASRQPLVSALLAPVVEKVPCLDAVCGVRRVGRLARKNPKPAAGMSDDDLDLGALQPLPFRVLYTG